MSWKMRSVATGPWFALLLLVPCFARALPSPLPLSLAPGDGWAEVSDQCRSKVGNDQVAELFADRFGDLVPALVDSGMLAMLNRAGAKHTLFQKPGGRKVSFLRVDADGGKNGTPPYQATLAFAAGKLEAVLVVAHVPPDATVAGSLNPFSAERLAPILDFRRKLGKECSLSAEGRGVTNRFDFSGKCGRFKARVEYHPEEDSFFILLYQ